MKKNLFKLFGLASLVLVLFSCSDPGPGTEAGSLVINFSPNGVANRTILPNINMDIASYVITGTL